MSRRDSTGFLSSISYLPFILAFACASRWCRSRGRRHAGARPCTCHKCASPMLEPSSLRPVPSSRQRPTSVPGSNPARSHTFRTILPRVRFLDDSSTSTLSPTTNRMKLRSAPGARCAVSRVSPSISTRYNPLGSCSTTTASTRATPGIPPVTSGRRRRATGARGPDRPRAASESRARHASPPPCVRSAPTGCRRASPPSTRPPAP